MLLGCRIGPDGALSQTAERRVEAAARALAAGSAPRVIVSGGRRWNGHAEAEVMSEALRARGVPGDALLLELLSLSTCENARFSAALAREHGFGELGVVTCDWHMRRAVAAFAHAGLVVQPFPARTPPAAVHTRIARAGREQVSSWVDRLATWGVS